MYDQYSDFTNACPNVQCCFSVFGYLHETCAFQHLMCTHFCYKQPAWVPVEIGPHISEEACTHVTVGWPSPMTGASWCPECATNLVCSATLTKYHTQRGLHKALPERGGNRLPSWKHIRSNLSGSQYVFAFYIHREIYHGWESDHTHPFFTGSNHGFNCSSEKCSWLSVWVDAESMNTEGRQH